MREGLTQQMKVEGTLSGGQFNGNAYATYPDEKWSIKSYFSIKGLENLLIYVWIAKDISWTTSTWIPAWLFGTLAVFLSFVFVCIAIYDLHYEEIWNGIAQLLWVFGNFWWMMGDVHDVEFPDERPIYDERQHACQVIMIAAMTWLGILYFIIRPFKLFPKIDKETRDKYCDVDLKPSMPFFNDWREYENFHLVLWLGKDLAWCLLNKPMWFVFTPPTFLINLDFICLTATVDGLLVDHVHYVSLLLWVIGNGTWALGELYWIDNDDPETLLRGSRPENANARWWASWILIFSYFPLFILHCYWIPLSLCTNVIQDEPRLCSKQEQDNKRHTSDYDPDSPSSSNNNVVTNRNMNSVTISSAVDSVNGTNNPIHNYQRHHQVVHYSSIGSGSDDGSRSRSNSASHLNSPQDPSEYSNDTLSHSSGSPSSQNSPRSSPSYGQGQGQGQGPSDDQRVSPNTSPRSSPPPSLGSGQDQDQGRPRLVTPNDNSNIDVGHQV